MSTDLFDDIDADDETPAPAAGRAPIADGIYLDLPMADYVADRALSGSAFKVLLTDPAGLWWDSPENPLWVEPTKTANRHRLRGSAAHCLILEGPDAYASAYCVPPEGVLSSLDAMKDWMRSKGYAHRDRIAQELGRKLTRDELKPYLLGDDKDELAQRILALDPDAPIWTRPDGKEELTRGDDAFVQLAARFITSDHEYAPYLDDGFSEVSIFLTVDGVRRKCRIDRMNRRGVVDLKTYGKPPRLGSDLKRHCVREACFNGADLQAVNNLDLLSEAAHRFKSGAIKLHQTLGPDRGPDAAKVRQARFTEMLAQQEADDDFAFRWLYVRMNGALTSIMLPFRDGDQMDMARNDIETAITIYHDMRDKCGDGIWMVSAGVHEIDEGDFPGRMSQLY